jgi:uncharacterized protein YeaO (DUF488 family)
MRLIKSIAKNLIEGVYNERELKNLYNNKNINSRWHIRDYGTMNKRLKKMRQDGILSRVQIRSSLTGRKNWCYIIIVGSEELQDYIDKKQKKFDMYVELYRKRMAATKEALESMKSEPTPGSDILAEIYAITTELNVKEAIEKVRPELAQPEQPKLFEFISKEDWYSNKSDHSFTCYTGMLDNPFAIGIGMAPDGLERKCLWVNEYYTPKIITDDKGTDFITFEQKPLKK